MSEKMFNTRIIHKHDTAENWEKATGFIPKIGELIVYDPDENFSYARTKMGDGLTGVNDLPFVQVQSDWNQNDENALDYIKNRTHWSKVAVGEVLPECSPSFVDNQYFLITDEFNLEVGKTYYVNWNGITYTATAFDYSGNTSLGNGSAFGLTDTGEPFSIQMVPAGYIATVGGYALCLPMDGSTTLTISITTEIEEVHKLDEKYLPDSVTTRPDWNAIESENGYILNRTHYTEEVLEEYIPEQTVNLTLGPVYDKTRVTGYFIGTIESEYPISSDDVFQVKWNGAKYNCEVVDYFPWSGSAKKCLGNNGMLGGSNKPQYPFLIGLHEGDVDGQTYNYIVYVEDGSTEVTFSVSKLTEVIHKIDEKYLPDSAINQSDWNQNDETVSDYIKNRTHYTEVELVEIYRKRYISLNEGETKLSSSNEVRFVAGKEYLVPWQFVEYVCVAREVELDNGTFVGLGNLSPNMPDTGEPFQILGYSEEMIADTGKYFDIVPLDGSRQFNVGIYERNYIDHKIDPKYIHAPDWAQNDETAAGYIKNRTHYINYDAVSVPPTQVNVDSGSYSYIIGQFEEGVTYNVIFDGVTYPCVWNFVDETYETAYLGNKNIAQGDLEDTNEPFVFLANLYYGIAPVYSIKFKENGTHTVGIEGVFEPTSITITDKYYHCFGPALVSGNTYKVKWNGVEYNLTASTGGYGIYLGNPGLNEETPSEGNEPFYILYDTGNFNMLAIKTLESQENTFSIEGILPEQTRKFDINFNSFYDFDQTWQQSLEKNKEYTVILDGIEYKCICKFKELYGELYIGSEKPYYPLRTINDYPFIITERGIATSTGIHEISVIEDLPVKIDEKFLPPMVGKKNLEVKGAEIFNDYNNNIASGNYSHAEGDYTTASGNDAHAEGWYTKAEGSYSHAEGSMTTASGDSSHAEGGNTTASGLYSHAEGGNTTASGLYSHAEGGNTTASGLYSHAEGSQTTASDQYAHAEGWKTTASGASSHAEGNRTVVGKYGTAAHAEGIGTKASSKYQHAQGKWNIEDTTHTYAHIVGNGSNEDVTDKSGNITTQNRSNAHTLDWDGNAWFQGDVYVGSTSGKNKDDGSKKLATEEYVDGLNSTNVKTVNGVAPDENGNIEIASSGDGSSVTIPTTLPNPYALTFTGAVEATYDGSVAVTVEIPTSSGSGESVDLSGYYTKTEIDAIMGSYINDIDTLLGGDA